MKALMSWDDDWLLWRFALRDESRSDRRESPLVGSLKFDCTDLALLKIGCSCPIMPLQGIWFVMLVLALRLQWLHVQEGYALLWSELFIFCGVLADLGRGFVGGENIHHQDSVPCTKTGRILLIWSSLWRKTYFITFRSWAYITSLPWGAHFEKRIIVGVSLHLFLKSRYW